MSMNRGMGRGKTCKRFCHDCDYCGTGMYKHMVRRAQRREAKLALRKEVRYSGQ